MKKQYLMLGGLSVFLFAVLVIASNVYADDTAQLKEQVKALQERVDQLESRLAQDQQAVPPRGYNQWQDPFAQAELMREQMDRNMQQTFAASGAVNPKMDLNRTDKEYVITMDLPGMDKGKIDIEAKDKMLIISGERKNEEVNNNFIQIIPLPEDVKIDQISAKYKNGALKVILPRVKKEEKRPGATKIIVR